MERTQKGCSLLMHLSDYVVLDFETTGLDPKQNEIIEVGAVRVRNGKTVDTYNALVRPQARISGYITELTGISNAMVADAPPITEVLPQLLNFIGGDVVVGHNVNFDINFLYENCMRWMDCPFCNDFVDTMRMSRRLFPTERRHRLCDLEQRFGLHNENAHRALADVMLTDSCYRYMCRYAAVHGIDL